MKGKIVADVQGAKVFRNDGTHVIMRLAPKTEVQVLEADRRPFVQGEWTKIRTPSGKIGWVNAGSVVRAE